LHETEPDLQSAIEDEMAASGQHFVVPRLAVIGAHVERVIGASTPSLEDAVRPPPGEEAAPTARALEEERARHRRRATGSAEPRFPAMPDVPPYREPPHSRLGHVVDEVRAAGTLVVGLFDLAVGLCQLGAARVVASVRSRFGL
jgi:hypothetical protein